MPKDYLGTALKSLVKTTTQLGDIRHEELQTEMANTKSETHRLSEDTKALKENSTKFPSKLDEYVRKIFSFTTYFD